jgi:hypothetical protein
MKLQKQFVSKVGDKQYYKYVLIIPSEIIASSGFQSGDELEAEAKKGEIKLRKK